ncbi:MAG TPA: alpha-ketoglutarate-dependent dioxygenase AlkB [Longimicrobium sp.]|nr:alpha-ketoglutarate-dependent dioxygenase AlkB [Longimicrobium sp.]
MLLPLFDTGETVLADDERGRIAYVPGFAPADRARAWFAALREGVQWKAERRRMYDREVDVPRLTSHYRLEPPDHAVPSAILEAAPLVVSRVGAPFNSVGLNFYRDGRDSVAPHNDHLEVLVEGFPIALVSLGSPRRMTIRAKEPPRTSLYVDLAPGSLLVMSYATQLHYTHGIPKTKEPVGERISLAFRVKPATPEGADPYR